MHRSILGAMLLLLLPNLALAQQLWGPTTPGMTPDEVVQAVDGAYLHESGDRLATGAIEAVRRDGYELAGEAFTQRFFFLNDGLTQVTMSLDNTRDFDALQGLIDSLSEEMRERYGEPVDSAITTAGTMRQAKMGWVDGRRKIRIFSMTMGEDDALLNVNYQAYFAD